MKKNSTATIMRRIAGILYGVLTLYGMFCLKFVLEGSGVGSAPFSWTLEVMLVVLAATFSAWLLAKDEEVSPAMRRFAPIITIFVLVFELMSYETQTVAVNYTLTNWFPGDSMVQQDSGILNVTLFGIKLVLIILAVFFVISSKHEKEDPEQQAMDVLEELDHEVSEVALAQAVADEVLADGVVVVEETVDDKTNK